MRLDPSQGEPAATLVNGLSEGELADLIWRFGEERHARRIASAIVAQRPLWSTLELAELVARAVGRRERIDPATRTFQALRIAVNDELGALSEAAATGPDALSEGGRLAVIAFHSLEDRIVKQFFQQETRDCLCPPKVPVCRCGHRATLRAITRRATRPRRMRLRVTCGAGVLGFESWSGSPGGRTDGPFRAAKRVKMR